MIFIEEQGKLKIWWTDIIICFAIMQEGML